MKSKSQQSDSDPLETLLPDPKLKSYARKYLVDTSALKPIENLIKSIHTRKTYPIHSENTFIKLKF